MALPHIKNKKKMTCYLNNNFIILLCCIQYKVVLREHLCPMMKHVYPGGSGLYQDSSALIQRAQGVTAWFDEQRNYVNHMSWSLQSTLTNTCRVNPSVAMIQ